nr:hypothetical protein [Sphingomonas oligophenolica]
MITMRLRVGEDDRSDCCDPKARSGAYLVTAKHERTAGFGHALAVIEQHVSRVHDEQRWWQIRQVAAATGAPADKPFTTIRAVPNSSRASLIVHNAAASQSSTNALIGFDADHPVEGIAFARRSTSRWRRERDGRAADQPDSSSSRCHNRPVDASRPVHDPAPDRAGNTRTDAIEGGLTIRCIHEFGILAK